MKRPTLTCPFCEGMLRNTDVYYGKPVVCPTCGASLRPPRRRGRLEALTGLCITLAICYSLGLSPAWFAVAAVLLWFPAFLISIFISGRIVPVRFEAYKPKARYESGILSLGLDQLPKCDRGMADTERPEGVGQGAHRGAGPTIP